MAPACGSARATQLATHGAGNRPTTKPLTNTTVTVRQMVCSTRLYPTRHSCIRAADLHPKPESKVDTAEVPGAGKRAHQTHTHLGVDSSEVVQKRLCPERRILGGDLNRVADGVYPLNGRHAASTSASVAVDTHFERISQLLLRCDTHYGPPSVPRAAAHIGSHSLHPAKRATNHAASSSGAFPLHSRTGFIAHAVAFALTRVGISALAHPRKPASRCRVCSSSYSALSSCVYCALCLSDAGNGATATARGEAKASLRVAGAIGSTSACHERTV